jgi:hypothetical protein
MREYKDDAEVEAFLIQVQKGHVQRMAFGYFAMALPAAHPHQAEIVLFDRSKLTPAAGAEDKRYPVVHLHFKGKRADCDRSQPCHGRTKDRCADDAIYRTVLQINLRHKGERTSSLAGKHVVEYSEKFAAEPWEWLVPRHRRSGGGVKVQPFRGPNGQALPLMELCFPSPRAGEVIRFIGEHANPTSWGFGPEHEQFGALWVVVRGADLRRASIKPLDSGMQSMTVALDVLEREFELPLHRDSPRPNHRHRSCLLNCCSVGPVPSFSNLRLPDDEYAQRRPEEEEEKEEEEGWSTAS